MKLTNKIHLLKIDFEISINPDLKISRFVNVIIILADKISLIDTGVKGSEKEIFDYIRQNGRDISEIDTIILSHSHPDHIGSAATIRELTGCRVLAHSAEKEWIENIDIQNRERPVPGFSNLVDKSVKIDDFLSDDQELKFAENLTSKIIHSPGHSKGSINILFREDKILFTADSIPLKNDIPNYDNYSDLLRSLNKIRANKAYDTMLTSWTAPLLRMADINRLIAEGEEYLKLIDLAVKEFYVNENEDLMASCKRTLGKLGLPSFLANQLVNKAFLSHLAFKHEGHKGLH